MSEQLQQNTTGGNHRYFAVAGYKPGLVIVLLAGLYILGFVILLWSAMPDYSELQTGITANDAAMVTAELQNANISYHYESSSGTVMVRSEQLNLARSILVEKGLLDAYSQPVQRSYSDPLRDSVKPGVSHGLPHQILEAELAKSIASIDNVQSARVHLAVDNIEGNNSNHAPRASVVVRLYHGRWLNEAQISSISHLVASSTANLSLDNITIIDQTGNLLKSSGASSKIASLSSAQFGYLRRLEQSYINRIMDILTPVLGLNTLRAQVVADIDFKTLTPEAMENPPPDNDAAENGHVRRLAVTVLVDNRLVDDGGTVLRIARSAEEMQRITELVKDAIGFNSQRGDTVTVVNEPFNVFSSRDVSAGISLWQGLWRRSSLWYLVIGLGTLITAGLIVSSMRKGINASSTLLASSAAFSAAAQPVRPGQELQPESGKPETDKGDRKTSFEQRLLNIRQAVRDDPKIAAQIVRSWVKEND
ncbi:MAG: hypothetical protein L0Z73_04340 [Gammaproteobacteria bacterium]|nr:hypothetical protein [Gammaproteobacteria bacterium]